MWGRGRFGWIRRPVSWLSLSVSSHWCSIMFSFIQVQLLKIQTVKSTKFLLHVNISIFLFFLLFVFFFLTFILYHHHYYYYYLSFLLFTIMATSLKSSWVRSGHNSIPGCFWPGFGPSPVQFWRDPVRSLHGTGLVALHSISPWARLAWRCKAWLYVGVCARSDNKAICTNQFKVYQLVLNPELRLPIVLVLKNAGQSDFWSSSLPEKGTSQPASVQMSPVCLCWNVLKT